MQVNSVKVAVGVAYEPILIHMTYKDIKSGFSTNLTLTVFRSDTKLVLWETACKMLRLDSWDELLLKIQREFLWFLSTEVSGISDLRQRYIRLDFLVFCDIGYAGCYYDLLSKC